MGKFKPAGSKKPASSRAADVRGAMPCLLLVLAGIVFLMVIFYLALQPGS